MHVGPVAVAFAVLALAVAWAWVVVRRPVPDPKAVLLTALIRRLGPGTSAAKRAHSHRFRNRCLIC